MTGEAVGDRMTGWSYQLRLVGPIALTSLLLVGLSGYVAVFLYRQQTTTAAVLAEDIGSRRAAADLEESLSDLAALHRDPHARVGPLHERVANHLRKIRELADKDQEKRMVDALTSAF